MIELKKIAFKVILLAVMLVGLNDLYERFFMASDIEEHAKVYKLIESIPDSTDILYIGESSNLTYSPYDVDKRKISEFLADYYPHLCVRDITKPASHAGTYYTLLASLPESSSLKTVVVTLNMRSFNAQWIYSDAETSLQKETILLKKYPPLFNRFLLSFKGYDVTSSDDRNAQIKKMWASESINFPYKFPFNNLKDWDHWLVHEGMKDKDGNIDVPMKDLASHYLKAYGLQINFDENPRIKDIDAIVDLAKSRGWNLVFNLLAENVDKAEQLVGKDLIYLMHENRGRLVKYYTKKGVIVADNLEAVRDEDFIDQDWTTEHYKERGRKAIAENVARKIQKLHPSAFEKPAFLNTQPTSFYNDCEDPRNVWGNMQTITDEVAYSGEHSSKAGGAFNYSMTMTYPIDQMVDSVKNNVVVDLKLFCPKKDASPKLVVELTKKGKTLKWLGINLFEEYTEIGKWQSFHYDLNLRQYLYGADLIKVFILNEEGSPCFVDDFKVAFK